MTDVTLKAGTNPIDEYNQFYEFMSQQIISEVDRRLTMLKITNDTSPIKTEEFLTECIATTFSRFGVCDVQMRVAYGSIILDSLLDNLADEVKDILQSYFPFEIEIKLLKEIYRGYTYDQTYKDDLSRWLRTAHYYFEPVDVCANSYLSDQETIDSIVDKGLSHIQKKVNEIAAPNRRSHDMMGINLTPYLVTRTMANTSYLRNMNITAHDTTIMLYQDLFPRVINMVRHGSLN